MKIPIHTTLSAEVYNWLKQESKKDKKRFNDIIEEAIIFYRQNKSLLREYENARIFLRELVKTELLTEKDNAMSFLRNAIKEEVKNKK